MPSIVYLKAMPDLTLSRTIEYIRTDGDGSTEPTGGRITFLPRFCCCCVSARAARTTLWERNRTMRAFLRLL